MSKPEYPAEGKSTFRQDFGTLLRRYPAAHFGFLFGFVFIMRSFQEAVFPFTNRYSSYGGQVFDVSCWSLFMSATFFYIFTRKRGDKGSLGNTKPTDIAG